MVEPISTTAAATAATAASTATTATTATTAVAATTASEIKADLLRRLAAAMFTKSEMLVVNESEIIEEFATPIYAGLAAASPGKLHSSVQPKAGTGVPSASETAFPNASMSRKETEKSLAPNQTRHDLEKIPEASDHPPVLVQDGSPRMMISAASPTSTMTDQAAALKKPEIKYLLNQYYPAPTIEAQLQTDSTRLVVERNLIHEQVVTNGDKKTAICLIEERIIDRKYLEYGHLSDVISEIRHGNIPTIHQIYLAMIDLTDLATFKMFRPLLQKYKLEDAQVRVRQLSADLEKKQLIPDLAQNNTDAWKIDRKVDKRSWVQTDHVTERMGHRDVTVEKTYEMVALNVRNVCTAEFNKPELDALLAKRNEFIDLVRATDKVNRIENYFSPEQIQSINKSAMVWTRENILTTTSEYVTDQEFHRYGIDLNGFLGEKITPSDRTVNVTTQTIYSEYLSESDNINLTKIDSYEDACKEFSQLQKTASLNTDPQLLAHYTEPSAGVQFKDGWVTYIPGGAIVNLGAKADLGAKLTGWDYFWAGVDVATIAVAAVTLGTSSVVTTAGKSATMAGAKAAVQTGAKTIVQTGAKAAVQTGAKTIAQTGTKAAVQTGAKTIAQAGTKAAVSTGVETIAQQTGKVTLKNVGQKASSQIATKTAGNLVSKTGLNPNASYIKNGFRYFTDSQGRVIKATGKLKNVPGIRNTQNQKLAAQMGKLGDEGGHLIPANYGGPGSLINHVPQARNVNRSVIKRIENEMGRALKAGKKVEYTIMPHYPDASTLRPDKFTIRYKIDGIQHIRRVRNA